MIVKEVINDVEKHHISKQEKNRRARFYYLHREKILKKQRIANITFNKSIMLKKDIVCPKCGLLGNLFYYVQLDGYKKTLHFCVNDALRIAKYSKERPHACAVSNNSEMRTIAKEVVTDNLFQYLLYEAIWKLVKWQHATNQEKSIAFVNLSRFGL